MNLNIKKLFILSAFLLLKHAGFSNDSTLLWKISGKDLKEPSYLYSTLHILCNTDVAISNATKEAISKTKNLFFEIDMSDQAALTKEMMANIAMKNGTTLNSLLSQANFDTASAKFQKITGTPLSFFKTWKPMMVASMLYPAMISCSTSSIEKEITDIAKPYNLPIKWLETISFQLSVFDEIPYEAQAKMLYRTVTDFEKAKKDFQKLMATYKTQKIETLVEETAADAEFGKYENILLTKRNENWIPQIEKAININSCFFAVGAAHLGGKNGVIQLLRNIGYSVTPVY
ncbi:MAG: TraB/GumN family protein [Chitinophagaceae bacterium]